MKKNFVFLAMLVCVLALGMTVAGCKDEPDNNDNSGGTFTPTSMTAYYDLGIRISFGFSQADSTLPGIANSKISDSCGFSITAGGNNVPVKEVTVGTSGIYVVPQNNLTAGQQATLSYTPNGTHTFKTTDGKTLGAFTLSGTVQ